MLAVRRVCAPRPGGSVSRARRAARPRKPRRGGRRSTGYGLARLFCTKWTVPRMSEFFQPKKRLCSIAVGPCVRAGALQQRCRVEDWSARASRFVTHLAVRRGSTPIYVTRSYAASKINSPSPAFFEHCDRKRARRECSRAMGRLQAPSSRVVTH